MMGPPSATIAITSATFLLVYTNKMQYGTINMEKLTVPVTVVALVDRPAAKR